MPTFPPCNEIIIKGFVRTIAIVETIELSVLQRCEGNQREIWPSIRFTKVTSYRQKSLHSILRSNRLHPSWLYFGLSAYHLSTYHHTLILTHSACMSLLLATSVEAVSAQQASIRALSTQVNEGDAENGDDVDD